MFHDYLRMKLKCRSGITGKYIGTYFIMYSMYTYLYHTMKKNITKFSNLFAIFRKKIDEILVKKIIHIERLRQRLPPIIPTKGNTACMCLYKWRGMVDFRPHFLGGYYCYSSIKPHLRIDVSIKKGVPFTAYRISIWFDFYDCSKNA